MSNTQTPRTDAAESNWWSEDGLRSAFIVRADFARELEREMNQLRKELDAARQKIARIMAGIEGCCMTCESVGVRNQQMEREIAMLATLLAKDRLNDEN